MQSLLGQSLLEKRLMGLRVRSARVFPHALIAVVAALTVMAVPAAAKNAGDRSRCVRMWRGAPVAKLLGAHVAAGKPLAGASADLAILDEKLYDAMDDGSIKSPEALAALFGPANAIEGDFLHIASLRRVVTDTCIKERDRLGRLGRLFAFVAEALRWSLAIHGGAGVIGRGDLTPAQEQAYCAGLKVALTEGGAVLDGPRQSRNRDFCR